MFPLGFNDNLTLMISPLTETTCHTELLARLLVWALGEVKKMGEERDTTLSNLRGNMTTLKTESLKVVTEKHFSSDLEHIS